MAKDKEKTVSPYTTLNRWLFDGSKDTKIPEEMITDKSIGQMYLLNFFKSSPYGMVISKLFNNWSLFSLDRIEVLCFLKDCVLRSGYKPPFVAKVPSRKNKLVNELKYKYPFLKNEEMFMIVDIIDNSEEKDSIYEMFGLYSPKKKKLTIAQKKQFQESVKKEQVGLDELTGVFDD